MNASVADNFHFNRLPFTREVSPKDWFEAPWYRTELSHLQEALRNNLSCAIVAPPGVGKTVLVRKLIHSMPESRFAFHYVKCSRMGRTDMYREICLAMGLIHKGSAPTLRHRLEESFRSMSINRSMQPVLVLDDAHEMRSDVLGILKLLTNYEMDSRLVLGVVLCGHPDLKQTLKQPQLEDVAMRISHLATPRNLSATESKDYIHHRCIIAGMHNLPFDGAAMDVIIELTRGNLRAMDDLCLKTLEVGARNKVAICDANHVTEARGYLL